MLRPLSVCSSSVLIAVALCACGTDDSKSTATTGTQVSSTSARKVEAPKVDPKTTEAQPKSEAPKSEVQKAEMPKAEKPVAEKPADVAKPEGAAGTVPVDAAIAKMREFIATLKIDKTVKNWKTTVGMPPKLTFDPARTYFWVLNTTEGEIKIKLMPDAAPMHVSSTIYLTEIGFYDDLLFHRVIPGFMAQGGDPLGNGTGGPNYKYASEFAPQAKHSKPGMLSMANTGAPSTDGSQFFLTFKATPHLDGKHTVFGEVVGGMDNVRKLESFGSPNGPTSKPLKIESAKIVVE